MGKAFARLHVAPLEPEGAARLVQQMLVLSPSVLEKVLGVAQGNPLHLIQQLRYLVTGRMLELQGDRWGLSLDAASPWPSGLAALLHARIEQAVQLGADARAVGEIVRLLPILGPRFDRALLEEFFVSLGRGGLLPRVHGALACLMRAGILEHAPKQAQLYRFVHAMFFEVLAARISQDPDRSAYHQAAAQAKERLSHDEHGMLGTSMGWHVDVARHWEVAGSHDKALEHRLRAARAAERGLDLEAARALYLQVERDLGHAEQVEERLRLIEVQAALGALHLRLGELGPAEDTLRRAVEAAKELSDVRGEGRALNCMGRLHTVRSQPKEALRCFRRAAACFKRAEQVAVEDAPFLAEALLGQAEVARLRGDLAAAEGLFREALELAKGAGAKEVEARSLHGLGHIAHASGRLREALGFLRDARDSFQQAQLAVLGAAAACDLGLSQLFTHGRAMAEATIRRALELLEETGDRLLCAHARLNLALALRRSPSLEESRQLAEQAFQSFSALDHAYGVGKAALLIGELDFLTSDVPAARDRGQSSLEIHERIGDSHGVGMSLMYMGFWELESGNLEQAQGHLTHALKLFQGASMAIYQPLCLLHLGRIEEQKGHLEAAHRLYTQSQQAAQQSENREALSLALAVLGGLAMVQGRLSQARGYFQQCQEIADDLDYIDLRGLALFGNAWCETLSGNSAARKRHLTGLAALMRQCPTRDFYLRERLSAISQAVLLTRGGVDATQYRMTALELIQQIGAS
jgi:tetratricopeptide (TPR) repeat protein